MEHHADEGRNGFAPASSARSPAAIAPLRDRGALVVVDQMPRDAAPDAKAWLEARSDALRNFGGYRLRSLRQAVGEQVCCAALQA
ncbi:MAG: hypothetical protein FJ301_02165 [Planctomycetes bacterium]|nr:hypothetical protein [Planctomycetota bacterium]